jgi:hypothetical protein
MSLLRRIAWMGAAAALMAIAMLSAWHGGRAAWADAKALSTRWMISAWRDGRGPAFTPQLWQDARDQLVYALRLTPDNPQLYDDLGYLHAARAQALGRTEAGSVLQNYQFKLLDEAIANYRAAAALRPTFPYSWGYLALAKHMRGVHDDEMWTAFDKSLQHGSSEVALRGVISQIAFDQWKTLGTARQTQVAKLVADAPAQACAKLLVSAKASGVTLDCLVTP